MDGQWTDLCKINSAKFTFQHACEPDVFAKIMGLDEPPTWKTKKMPVNEFKETFGEVCGHARFVDTPCEGMGLTSWFKV